VRVPDDLQGLTERLERGGFVAAGEEAAELLARAAGDRALLDAMVARRETGEPLAWITGTAPFHGLWIRVDAGVYVPRWQTELIAERAIARLADGGLAIDVCTGSGALAKALAHARPHARVLATDVDERAVACARANGVEVYAGDLFAPLPGGLAGRVDLVTGVVPYVPTPDLPLLQRDTFAFETALAYDGGADGTALLRRALAGAAALLRPGGALVLELGGEQARALADELRRLGYREPRTIRDEDGDARGIEATFAPR